MDRTSRRGRRDERRRTPTRRALGALVALCLVLALVGSLATTTVIDGAPRSQAHNGVTEVTGGAQSPLASQRALPAAHRADRIDRGIGIVYFDPQRAPGPATDDAAAATSDAPRADTIVLYRDTLGAAVAGRFILRGTGRQWSYSVQAREPVESASFEYAYEVHALPVAEATPDERWVRAIFGVARDGTQRSGWVKVTPGAAGFRRWPRLLRDRSLFFDAGVAPEFFGSPRGRPVEFPIVPGGPEGRGDYIMHPVAVDGDWMQVRITTPADTCGATSVRQALVWIRYLDERARPRVWYRTRGC